MSRSLPTAPQLYLLTPDGAPTTTLLQSCESALGAGAGWLQYRDKSNDHSRRAEQATALRVLTRHHGAVLIINDDVQLARACDADGVHLGEHDDDPAAARALLGAAAIIGVSCYDQFPRARTAAAAGASYLAFGAFFPSATKPATRRARPEILTAAGTLGLPLCAIGGIEAANAAPLVSAGADLIAVVNAVFAAPDPAQATGDLLEAMSRGWALRNATRQMPH